MRKKKSLGNFERLLLVRAFSQAKISLWQYRLWGMKERRHFKQLRDLFLDGFKKSLPIELEQFKKRFKTGMDEVIIQAKNGHVRSMGILLSWDKSFLALPWAQDFLVELQMKGRTADLAFLGEEFKRNYYFAKKVTSRNKDIAEMIERAMHAHRIAGGKNDDVVREQIYEALLQDTTLPDRFQDKKYLRRYVDKHSK